MSVVLAGATGSTKGPTQAIISTGPDAVHLRSALETLTLFPTMVTYSQSPVVGQSPVPVPLLPPLARGGCRGVLAGVAYAPNRCVGTVAAHPGAPQGCGWAVRAGQSGHRHRQLRL